MAVVHGIVFMYNFGTTMYDDGFSASFGFGWFIYLFVCAFILFAQWRMYEKLGLKGWYVLIPVYDMYVLAKRVWDEKHAKILLWLQLASLLSIFVVIFSLIGSIASMATIYSVGGSPALAKALLGTIGGWILLYLALTVLSIAIFVFKIMVYHRLSKTFGHDTGFTIGLVLVPVVFMAILGLSSSEKVVDTADKADIADKAIE